MARKPVTRKNIEAVATAEPTELQKRFAEWIYIQTGIRPDLKTVQLACALRMDFQASPENQAHLAEKRAKAAEAKKSSAERKKAKLEAELAKLKGEVTGSAAVVVEDGKAEMVVEAPVVKADPVKLTIVYGGNEPEVHKAGCADIKKARRRGKSQETSMFSSHTELTHHIYSDMIDSGESSLEDNYMAYDAKPCCPALDN
jgi:hypothetical protein